MSTTAPEETMDVTTFRGRTLEELLPQIRDQLGPEAVVIRQRDGLVGGIGGFFQQRFIEVDARAGHTRIDVYDEEPAEVPAEPEPEPAPFAQLLAAAESADDGGPRISVAPTDPDPGSSPEPVPFDAQTAVAPALDAELQGAGMSATFAERLVADAEAHELPFAQDLRAAVRSALARRVPTALPRRAGGLSVAFAGPGSTACASALAAAYKRAGRDARAIATLDQARARIERGDRDAVVVLDVPPIATERAEVQELAERIARIELDEVVAVVSAADDLPAARALLDRLQPLAPTALAVTLDAHDEQLGAALELACTTRVPLAYVLDGSELVLADPARLAERLLR